MQELKTEELEELVQELEGESGAEESLPPEVEKVSPPDVEELLRVLQSGTLYLTRRNAAEQLGKVGTSSPRIVQVLIVAQDSDSNSAVRRAAAKSLRAPVHQEHLEQSDPAKWSFLASMFHDPRWKWAPVYAVFLLVTTALVFAVDNLWVLLPAGLVWLAGCVLGLRILQRKGHPVGGLVFGLLDLGDDLSGGCVLALLALFALAGPAILLVALFVRPRGSVAGMSKRRAKAKATGRRRPVPARNRPSDCPACGAWNAPASENCGECGVVLEGVAV